MWTDGDGVEVELESVEAEEWDTGVGFAGLWTVYDALTR
jgi:hypothetical protein